MSNSLSSLVDNLSEGLHNDKCTTINNHLIFKCLKCKKSHKKYFNKDLIKRFINTFEFCDGDINKSVLLLRKEIYPYEYIESWQRFDETLLPDREDFYSDPNMEDIRYADYMHAKKN